MHKLWITGITISLVVVLGVFAGLASAEPNAQNPAGSPTPYADIGPAPTPGPDMKVWSQELYDGLGLVHRLEVYKDGTGRLWLRYLDASGRQIGSRYGTQTEAELYDRDLRRDSKIEAGERLGNTVTTLRQWAKDAQDTATQWDSLTQAQKDTRVKVLIERTGRLLDRTADPPRCNW